MTCVTWVLNPALGHGSTLDKFILRPETEDYGALFLSNDGFANLVFFRRWIQLLLLILFIDLGVSLLSKNLSALAILINSLLIVKCGILLGKKLLSAPSLIL